MTTRVALLEVPYHLGSEGAGMALGPRRYLEAGAAAVLEGRGCAVDVVPVRRSSDHGGELENVVAVNVSLAGVVRAAVARGAVPLVAGGNCNVVLGMVAGLGAADTAIVWFDAHGDFNTPETTPSGFLDGMPLAMACGRAHSQVWGALGGAPVPEAHVLHVGARDLDAGEVAAFAASPAAQVTTTELRERGAQEALAGPLRALTGTARRAYLHVDIDVLDPELAPGVDFPSPGGLTPEELVAAVDVVAAALPIAGVALTAYDPENDRDDVTLRLGLALLADLAGRARLDQSPAPSSGSRLRPQPEM